MPYTMAVAGAGAVQVRASLLAQASTTVTGRAAFAIRFNEMQASGAGEVQVVATQAWAGALAVSGVGQFEISLTAPVAVQGSGRVGVDTQLLYRLSPPPVPAPVDPADPYLALIPPYNAVRPRFMAELRALLAPATALQGLLAGLPAAFDLDTAIGVQLDQVGLWIGRSRRIETPIVGVYFSWDIAGLGWEQGTWQGTFDPSSGLSILDDNTYRSLLRAKVAANKWDGTADGIVEAIRALFEDLPEVTVQVHDHQDMTMTVEVTGIVSGLVFRSLLLGGYVPIKPVGVGLDYVLLDAPLPSQAVLAQLAIAGAGTLSAAGRTIQAGRAAITGAGSVVHVWSVGSTITIVSQPFFGAASLSAPAAQMRAAGRLLAVQGAGTLAVDARVFKFGSASVAGHGATTISVPATVSRVTNWVRNPNNEGLIAGTPGTDATDWYIDNAGGPGLTKQIIGSGTVGGIPYQDVRLSGTNGTGDVLYWQFQYAGGDTGVYGSGVANGQTWSAGAYATVLAGLSGIYQTQIGFASYDNAWSYLRNYSGSNLFIGSGALGSQFYSLTNTIIDASPTYLVATFTVTVNTGALDITVRIGGTKFVHAATIDGTLILPRAGSVPPAGSGTTFVM